MVTSGKYPPVDVNKALRHLAATDPGMKALIARAGEIRMEPTDDYFKCLVVNIISQLISSKAADTVIGRLDAHVRGSIAPEVLVQLDTETYRSFGIGPQKSANLRGLAQSFLESGDRYASLHLLDNAAVVKRLTELRGIGKWTAEMFLIFGLARPDVFAPDDLGLKNAMIRYFGMPATATRKEMVVFAERWAPYRSVASLLLWRSLSVMEPR